jgi:hypothetical protein
LPARVIHVDLKGPKIPFPVFKKLLQLYARWGINGVLVEYEHRLPALPLPRQFPRPARYTRGEVETLVGLSGKLGLEYIPFVQTLGHVEYLRHLPGTARLMESPTYPSQLCPSRRGTRDYLARLIAAVCDLHPTSRYFCVGLDETHQLGHCPVCKRRAADLGGKLELYLDHARWVCGQVLQRGRIPMLAGDMLLGNGREELIAQLDPRAIVMPWDYTAVTPRSSYVLYKGWRPLKAAFRHDPTGARWATPLPAFPAPGGFADDLPPRDLHKLGGLTRSLGQVHLMANFPRPLWGICAAARSADGLFHPDFARGLHNCKQMVRTLLDRGGHGAIATVWARGHSFAPINSMWPLSLYALAQFAAMSWSGQTAPRALRRQRPAIAAELDLPPRFGEWTLDDVLWVLSNPTAGGASARAATLRSVLDLLRRSKGKGMFFDGLLLAVELEIQWQELLFLLDEARWWHPNRQIAPPVMGAGMRTRLKAILKDIDRLKPKARRFYVMWVGDKTSFETWWRGLFEVDRRLAARAVRLV